MSLKTSFDNWNFWGTENTLLDAVALVFILFIDLEHVKAKWKWNITIERSGVVTGKLEGQNVLQLKFYNARRVSWMKGIERKVDLSVNKNKKYPRKWLKIYERNQFFEN